MTSCQPFEPARPSGALARSRAGSAGATPRRLREEATALTTGIVKVVADIEDLPSTVEAHIRPEWFTDGDPITIEVQHAAHLAERELTVVVTNTTAIETHWVLQVPITLDSQGNGTVRHPGVNIGREGSVYVNQLIVSGPDGPQRVCRFPNVHVSIANATSPIESLEDVAAAHVRILSEQQVLYAGPLGRPDDPGMQEHRVLHIVQGLYITTPLRLPAVEVRPVAARPTGAEERQLIDDVLVDIGWPTRITEEIWHRLTKDRNPLALIVCNPIWASTYEEAADLARNVRDRVIALMAVNRGATGRPVCLVVEQRQPDDTVLCKWTYEGPGYQGNLAGGFISGESQSQLLSQYQAVDKEPLLKLCCDLYGEALTERSVDAKFLRLWSILEFLSAAGAPKSQKVYLRDGSPWPNPKANTTRNAAPRVYYYLATLLAGCQHDEASFVDPAANLYEAVRVWYARRNATAHYGRFVLGDASQQSNGWYALAAKSAMQGQDARGWAGALQRCVEFSITKELGR